MPIRNNRLTGNILPSGMFSPATFEGNTFTPQQADMNLLARSLDKIEQREITTNQQRGAIAKALADVELNEAEDEWKANYANRIQDEINGLIAFGDYSNALNRAAVLAGKSLADPALRGRVRAQRDYKTFVDNTLARKDLTEDDKSWALAMNPYKYEDKFDSRGNVVGGTDWKPTTRPVGEIDYNKLLATAKQLVFQESGGSTQVVFYDAEGKDTTNPLNAEGVKYYKNGQWQGISKKKLNQILEAAIDNEPGARARLEQDWQVANWKYDQLSEDEKAINKPSELFASNGRKYSKQEWYNNKFGRAIDAMSGMNYSSSIKYDDDYSRFMSARRAGALAGMQNVNGGGIDISTGLGTPAQVETENVVNKAFGKVTSGTQDIEKLLPSYFKNTKSWQEARKNGDYNTLAKLAEIYVNTHDVENKQGVKAKIRDLKDNASLVSSVKRNNGDYDAVAFNGAFSTGGELPADNKYTNTWMNLYNQTGGTKLRYAFATEEERTNFMEKLGLNQETNSNLKGNDSNGYPTLTIDKSNSINNKAIVEYFNGGYGKQGFWKTIFSPTLVPFVGVDDNGVAQPVKSFNKYGYKLNYDILMRRMAQHYNSVFGKANNTSKELASNVVTVTTKHMPLPGVSDAIAKYPDDPSKREQEANFALNSAFNNIMHMHGSQYEMYLFDEKTNTLSRGNITDRTEALSNVQSYLNENASNLRYLLATRVVDGKAGYSIVVPKQWNKSKNAFKDGDIGKTEIVIFNIDDPDLNKMQRDTKYQSAVKYDRLSRINNASHTTFDNVTINFRNSVPYLNGNPIRREAALAYMDRDQAYEDLKSDVAVTRDGQVQVSPNFQVALTNAIMAQYGYPVGSPENIEKATSWFNQMVNELK